MPRTAKQLPPYARRPGRFTQADPMRVLYPTAPRGGVWTPAGRAFTFAGQSRVDYGRPAALANLANTSGGFTVLAVGRRLTEINNQFVGGRSSGTTAGWEFLHGWASGASAGPAGYLRGIVWTSTGRYDSQSVASQSVVGSDDITGYDFDPVGLSGSNGFQFFRAAHQTPIAAVTGTTLNAGSGVINSDAAAALWGFNDQRSNTAFDGYGSWLILAAPKLTLAEKWDVQLATLLVEAGDILNAVALFAKSGKVKLASRINWDGSTTDYGPNGVEGALIATAPAPAINNDVAGACLSQLHSLYKNVRNNVVGRDGIPMSDYATSYPYVSDFAGVQFDNPTATSVAVWAHETFIASAYNAQQSVTVESGLTGQGGSYAGQIVGPGTVGAFGGTVAISAGSPVSILAGPRSRAAAPPLATEPQEGTFPCVAYFNAAVSAVAEPVRSARVVLLTDSTFAFVGNPAGSNAVVPQLRRVLPSYYDAVEQAGYGGAMVAAFTNDPTQLGLVVDRVTWGNPARIVISLGANDKINSTLSAANFQTALGQLVDAILARASFTGRIVLYSPLITSTQEGANGIGVTMPQIRTAVSNVASTRTARVDFRDGSAAVSVGNLSSVDGVHLLNAGLAELLTDVQAAIAQGFTATMTARATVVAALTTAPGANATSAVTMTGGSGYAESSSSISAIGTATALALKLRIRGDFLASGNGYMRLVQIDESRTTNMKLQIGFRSEVGATGVVIWDTTDGSLTARQVGGTNPSAFNAAKYYVIYLHYDPASATDKFHATVTLDDGSATQIIDGANNGQTGALPNSATYGKVRVHRASDLVAGNFDVTVDGLAIYSAIIPAGAGRYAEPQLSDANLLAYYPFNEGTGTSIAEALNGVAPLTLGGTTSWQVEGSWPAATGAASLAATIATAATVSAALSTAITLAAAPNGAGQVVAALSTSITMAAAPNGAATVTAALTTSITMAAAPNAAATVAAALSTSITMAASAATAATVAAALLLPINLAAAPNGAATVAAALTTAIRLAAAPNGSATVTPALTTAITMAATAATAATIAAALTTAIRLAAAPNGAATVTPALTTSILLASSATGAATLAPTLQIGALLAADVTGTALTTAQLTTAILLAAQPIAGAATMPPAALTVAITMAADVVASANVDAQLTTAILLAAAASASALTTAQLTTAIRLAADLAATADVDAQLTTAIQLAASLAATASVTGALDVAITMAASPTATALTSAQLTTAIVMAASAAGAATTNALLVAGGQFFAQLTGTATSVAALTTAIALAAQSAGLATVSGALDVRTQFAAQLTGTATVSGALGGIAAQLAASMSASASAVAAIDTAITMAASSTARADVVAAIDTAITLSMVAAAEADVVAGFSVGVVLSAIVAASATVAAELRAGVAVLARVRAVWVADASPIVWVAQRRPTVHVPERAPVVTMSERRPVVATARDVPNVATPDDTTSAQSVN